MTLEEFLLARIAEDKAAASDVLEADSKIWPAAEYDVRYQWARDVYEAGRFVGTNARPGAPSPARVLAECEAKRQIVKLAQQDIDDAGAGHDDPIRHAFNRGAAHHAHNVLRLLAQAYADHPDYREEWRP